MTTAQIPGYTYRYPRPALTVDCVVFGFGGGSAASLDILLVERKDEPFKGRDALPGGFVNVSDNGGQGEDLEAAARRELWEETGIRPAYLEQLCTVGTPGRDPRGRVVTVAYFALVRTEDHLKTLRAGSDASGAGWTPIDETFGRDPRDFDRAGLAFDHGAIVATALRRLQAKIRYAPIGFHLLPERFTLGQLQHLYEAILMRRLDRGNFRRILRRMNKRHGILTPAGTSPAGKMGRPATLYRWNARAYAKAAAAGFHFEL